MKEKFPLLPKSDSPKELNFYIQLPTEKMEVEFEIDKNNKVHLAIERNLFHKQYTI